MNKTALFLLMGLGAMLALTDILGRDEMMSAHIVLAMMMLFLPVYIVASSMRNKMGRDVEEACARRDANNVWMARREIRSKIPKSSPRRESRAAFEGSTKLGAARSMAALVRKPRLREKILDICEFADMVLETIRRMPSDTPAADVFAETHLSKLNDALEQLFEMSRSEEYKQAPAALDAQEIECFGKFIVAFKKQQDNILLEGKTMKDVPEYVA
jgi:hypothetical protein